MSDDPQSITVGEFFAHPALPTVPVKPATILMKYPTRGRPAIFLTRLKEWLAGAARPEYIIPVITCDLDDATMTDAIIQQAKALHPRIRIFRGTSRTKVEAINANIGDVDEPWDIVIVVSDDMVLREKNWDELVREKMGKYFPSLEGALWFHDGTKQRQICTLPIMGRAYYEQFGYIYLPEYCSFFCDNEWTAVGLRRGKLIFIDEVIASHEHPAWNGGMRPDTIYKRNNKYWSQDSVLYNERLLKGFPNP